MTDKPQIIKVLDDAQRAHRGGDFVSALKFYEHFFDHALDDDPYALYAVRLSHCLQGWAELAMIFPAAKNRLENKKRDMFSRFQEGYDPERFHDYLSICRQLGQESEALEKFLGLHRQQPKTAAKLVKYLWDDLISAEHLSVCNDFLEQPSLKLDELFTVFDEANRLQDIDPSFNNARFEQHIVDQLLSDVQNVVLILRSAGRGGDIEALQRQFHQAVESRNHSVLHKQVHARSSFLFTGH